MAREYSRNLLSQKDLGDFAYALPGKVCAMRHLLTTQDRNPTRSYPDPCLPEQP